MGAKEQRERAEKTPSAKDNSDGQTAMLTQTICTILYFELTLLSVSMLASTQDIVWLLY